MPRGGGDTALVGERSATSHKGRANPPAIWRAIQMCRNCLEIMTRGRKISWGTTYSEDNNFATAARISAGSEQIATMWLELSMISVAPFIGSAWYFAASLSLSSDCG